MKSFPELGDRPEEVLSRATSTVKAFERTGYCILRNLKEVIQNDPYSIAP